MIIYLTLLECNTLLDNVHFLLGDILLEDALLANRLDVVTSLESRLETQSRSVSCHGPIIIHTARFHKDSANTKKAEPCPYILFSLFSSGSFSESSLVTSFSALKSASFSASRCLTRSFRTLTGRASAKTGLSVAALWKVFLGLAVQVQEREDLHRHQQNGEKLHTNSFFA